LDLEPQPKTAARRWAEAYYKATSRNVRLYFNQAHRESYADLRYVEWLENQLEAVLAAAREAKADLTGGRG
jgi:hypothetical protein